MAKSPQGDNHSTGVMADYTCSGFFVLRSPTMPFDALLQWSEGLEATTMARADDDALEQAIQHDRERLRASLRAHFATPHMRDAIFIASPSLHANFAYWEKEPDSKRGQKVECALVKYFIRMSARVTPFGLFSGCSVGHIGEHTALEFVPLTDYKRHTRLDMDYLYRLTATLGRAREVRQCLTYYPNSSLYRAAGRLRYAEARLKDTRLSYYLVAVQPTAYLDATLERAKEGARLADLATALVRDEPALALDEAHRFLDELVDSQLLISPLAPAVTGGEALHGLIAQLAAHHDTRPTAAVLGDVRDRIEAIDTAGLGGSPERYLTIASRLEALPTRVEIARLFQVDMTKPVYRGVLGPGPLTELSRGVDILYRMTPQSHGAMESFRDEFIKRYGERCIPLAEALDEEIGIGFQRSPNPSAENAPLLEGVQVGQSAQDSPTLWSKRHCLLLHKLNEMIRQGGRSLELSSDDIDTMAAESQLPLPDAMQVMAVIAAPSTTAIDAGDFTMYVMGASGPSGARLFGRFCYVDPELEQAVRGHLQAEEAHREEAIYAEIVHLPQGRLGNILSRPVLREHEIVFLGLSGAVRDKQIPISDLYIAVHGDRVTLQSSRYGCEVMPRLSTAHNYSRHSQGVYRFLCSLQSQGVAGGLSWSWGPLESLEFLPRVTHGRLVLSRATWHVSAAELKSLTHQQGVARFKAVQQWREQRCLPRFIVLVDGDNELPVDLDNVLAVDAFLHLIAERSGITLVELFPGPDELCVSGPEGHFMHELVIPWVKKPASSRQPEAEASMHGVRHRQRPLVDRAYQLPQRFVPGSDWLYVKLYTGTATADTVLRDAIAPVVETAIGSGWADQWFFIRYGDPDWHLRVRFHGVPHKLLHKVQPLLQHHLTPLLDDGSVWRLQYDTYEREMHRYGGDIGMELSEQLFWADSEAVLEIVKQCEGDLGATVRWHLAFLGTDYLLDALGFDLGGKITLATQARHDYGTEFNTNSINARRQLNTKYRAERKTLEALWHVAHGPDHLLTPGIAALKKRSARLVPIIAALHAVDDRLTVPRAPLTRSYIHMHINRMLRSGQRAQEMVLYDFLTRFYQALVALGRQDKCV